MEKAQQPDSNQANGSRSSKGLALPQHLIGHGETENGFMMFEMPSANMGLHAVHDENLKNLLMSWYYAGYYTGLYEGQQQGAASRGT